MTKPPIVPASAWRLLAGALLLLMVAWGCATAPLADPSRTLLNSERIEARFGSYGIEVLEDSDTLRVSNLYSVEDRGPVGRTFAVVRYAQPLDTRIAEEHATITAGGSIGAVFTAAGWRVEKRHRYVGEIPSEDSFDRVRALMGPLRTPTLAVHVYDLVLERPGASVVYATLAEVHHPDYLTAEALQRIYGPVSNRATEGIRVVLRSTLREMGEPHPSSSSSSGGGAGELS